MLYRKEIFILILSKHDVNIVGELVMDFLRELCAHVQNLGIYITSFAYGWVRSGSVLGNNAAIF